MTELEVQTDSIGKRLDVFLAAALPQISRARLQTLIKEGFILRNDQRARPRDVVRLRDKIIVQEPAAQPIENRPEEIPLDILFEDEHLIIINKSPDMVVHPGAGNSGATLVNALLHHCAALSGIGGQERPGIVHRLDKQTSGCLVVAKTDSAHQQLSRQFASREVDKIYLAIARGRLVRKAGRIEAPIGRHPVQRQKMSISERKGRAARTDYRLLATGPEDSLVECTLHTGRTHQIRVHLHHLGHPIVGDGVYGARRGGTAPRQMLHAWKLGFTHPVGRLRCSFVAPVPQDFREAMRLRALPVPAALA